MQKFCASFGLKNQPATGLRHTGRLQFEDLKSFCGHMSFISLQTRGTLERPSLLKTAVIYLPYDEVTRHAKTAVFLRFCLAHSQQFVSAEAMGMAMNCR